MAYGINEIPIGQNNWGETVNMNFKQIQIKFAEISEEIDSLKNSVGSGGNEGGGNSGSGNDYSEAIETLSKKVEELGSLLEQAQNGTEENSEDIVSLRVLLEEMTAELEVVRNNAAGGLNNNVFLETFANLEDIELSTGIYDPNRRLIYVHGMN